MRSRRLITLFLLLLGFWLALSARLDPLFVGMGVVTALSVTLASARLLEVTIGSAATHPRVRVVQLIPYTTWLLARMTVSAFQIARIVLDPRVPPEPGIAHFRTQLTSPAARAMLADSITLVPGTMTLEVQGGDFTVHSFTPDAMDDLSSAEMQNRIARVFGDPEQAAPEIVWEQGHTGQGFLVVRPPADIDDLEGDA